MATNATSTQTTSEQDPEAATQEPGTKMIAKTHMITNREDPVELQAQTTIKEDQCTEHKTRNTTPGHSTEHIDNSTKPATPTSKSTQNKTNSSQY